MSPFLPPLTYAAGAGPARSKTKLFLIITVQQIKKDDRHFVLLSRGAKRYLSDKYAVPINLFYIHRRYRRNLIFWGLILYVESVASSDSYVL